jgi:peptidoglycan/xylan/chitin deacetylase (PgdA/CDA1 family)
MIGRMTIKRTLKRVAGGASLALHPLAPQPRRAACILAYHRVADIPVHDRHRDNWNVPPALFERHMSALAGWADVVPLDQLPALLREGACERSRPRVCLTFDDGFASVCGRALPVLERHAMPATVFVVTSCIGAREPMPFDGWSRHNAGRVPIDSWRPMGWLELERCVGSGLIGIGAHSHAHRDGRLCTPSQLVEEAERSREILRARLGPAHARAYAYPFGSTRLGEVSPVYVEIVRAAGYERAVSTDLGLVTSESDPFVLPRVEASGVDSPSVLRAKVRGSLAPLRVTDWLRRADRTA